MAESVNSVSDRNTCAASTELLGGSAAISKPEAAEFLEYETLRCTLSTAFAFVAALRAALYSLGKIERC
ncbi:MAG: hypothetical protein KGM47_12770 [Acidobacteriota bacterium]|nr:hypothetical protein [Acidobacteriota bacterium]